MDTVATGPALRSLTSCVDGRTAAQTSCIHVGRGETVFCAGDTGQAWRVVCGVVRLDRECDGEREFGGLARVGDVIGAETLLLGRYTYTAVALMPSVLEAWSHDQAPAAEREHKLLQALATAERRMADVLALRGGKAAARVRRLLGFLAGNGLRQPDPCVVMPRLRDIAEITDLKVETVSRTISQLSQDGEIAALPRRQVRLHYAEAQAGVPDVTAGEAGR
ncbi:Crp/Fnr family transcriptional regulator [Pseudothauera lacus]|uniref:Crp/Fnr family transcriptional regulator n=1 Tax=Pseudothauera lacus TaxID=2136175 RepID=A0A2T4IK66_9RHOO|nr:Crp/Fnr family transcriptional regulator [Pseudothauera lacus]